MFKKVYIEITNNCNLNCSFCIGNKRDKKFIDINDFKVLLRKLKGYSEYLYFHVMGEPLLHPEINRLIDIASEDYKINLTTNGYLIDRIKDNDNIRQINVSLHSYSEINGKPFNEYMDDIFKATDSLLKNGTIIKYRMWINSDTKYNILSMLEDKYNVSIGDKRKVKLSDNVFYEVEDEFIWPSLDNDYYNNVGSCRGTRDHIGILVDGTVVPCCLDSEGIINLGNIYKVELNDIINSEFFQSINKGFLENKKICELCKKCNFYTLRR